MKTNLFGIAVASIVFYTPPIVAERVMNVIVTERSTNVNTVTTKTLPDINVMKWVTNVPVAVKLPAAINVIKGLTNMGVAKLK